MRTCRTPEEDLRVIREEFRLDGEDVVRIRTGRALRHPKDGERMNVSCGPRGAQRQFKLYRIKFALRHGWLPPSVDHKDRVPGHDSIGNLRPASATQQQWNQQVRSTKASGLPRGVTKSRSRFVAQAKINGKSHHLGVFPTAEQASECYRAFCAETRGEFGADLQAPRNDHGGSTS